MDYKQKYEEALERAKMYQGMVVLPAESMIETIFPELAESKDEKTRKEIVDYLKKNLRLEWATWLEKQGQSHWSEEDEKLWQSIIDDSMKENQLDNEQINWFISIKNRIKGE